MRQERDDYDRVTRRSSSGVHRGERDGGYRENAREYDDRDRYDDRDFRDDRYPAPRYDDRDRRDDRYPAPRYDDRDRREDRYPAPRYDDRDRRDDRYPAPRRDDERRDAEKMPRSAPRKHAGGKRRRVGGDTERTAHQVIPYVMFWVGLFAAVSFVLRDLVSLEGSTGAFGSWFANFLCGLFGPGAYVLPLFFVVLSLRWKKFVRGGILAERLLLSTAFVALLSGIIHVFLDIKTGGDLATDGAVLYNNGVLRTGGGFFGGFLGEWMGYALRWWGSAILGIPLLIIVGIYLVGLTPSGLWQRISGKFKLMKEAKRAREAQRYDGKEGDPNRSKADVPAALQPSEASARAPQPQKEPMRYTFREEEDEVMPRRTKSESATDSENEIVDIPDDEIEICPEEKPAEQPQSDVEIVLGNTANKHSLDKELEDILRGIEQETARPVPQSAPQQSTPVQQSAPTQAQPEKTYQGDYFAPFALPIRPEPTGGLAQQAAAAQAMEAAASEVAVEAPDAVAIAASIPTPIVSAPVNEEAPKEAERDPLAEIFGAPEVTPQASAPVQGGDPLAEFFGDEDESDTAVTVPFERTHLDGDSAKEPVSEPAAEPVSTETVDEAPMSFVFDLDSDEGEVLDDAPVSPAPRPVTPTAPVRPTAPAAPVAPAAPAREEPKPVQPPREYRFPPMLLLNEDKSIKDDDHEEEDHQKIEILRRTLESFNVRIKEDVTCSRGPTVTRYELCPEIGVSVRAIMSRADDISLYMSGANVRIAPIPGKTAIGIEVPNTTRETVYMRTLLESAAFKNSKKPLEVPLGMGIGGEVQMCDLSAMPHLLVAGTTGSGKSVCINAMLISLMYKTSPRDLRLILVDPKRVEFKVYSDLPHLYAPIITEAPRAIGALACAVQEMERRYSLMEDVGVRTMDDYNRVTANDPDREHLPRLVIVIDEFYDLKMACTNNDVENYCCRLAQKARAAGIHLIIGTQRPSVNVITGTLKANIPSRIAFTVNQQVDSRTILDGPGAELLTGRGDMLYSPVGAKPTRWQGPFVSDEEVAAVVDYVRSHNDPVHYNQSFMDQVEMEMARAANNGKKRDDIDDYGDGEDGDEDPKFLEAVELAIQTQKVATSLLQRRLGVGYGRAAKIIDRMEELGLVTPSEGGNKPRKLLPAAQGYLDHMANLEDGEDDVGDGPDGFTEEY